MNGLSVAIPVYNRAEQVLSSFMLILDDSRVNEIVLLDDCSNDYEELYKNIHRISSPKIKIYRNGANLKAFHNKAKVVSLCQNSWVLLLDSDNSLDSSYLDALYAEHRLDPKVLYCPSFARPYFDFSSLAGVLMKAQDLYLLSQFSEDIQDERISSSYWSALFNCGNYVVHKETYLTVYETYQVFDDYVGEPYAADVAYFNTLWLRQGFGMKVIPNMEYNHTISPDSFSFMNVDLKNNAYRKSLSLLIDYCYQLDRYTQ